MLYLIELLRVYFPSTGFFHNIEIDRITVSFAVSLSPQSKLLVAHAIYLKIQYDGQLHLIPSTNQRDEDNHHKM